MDILKAYWRMDYIRGANDATHDVPREDTFLELPRRGDDRDTLIIFRGEHNYLVLNKFPYNAGHLLAVPYEKFGDLREMTVEVRADLMETIVRGEDLLQRALQPDGFNIGFNLGKTAGAGIPQHLHAHIIPRWEGDSNFVTVIGQTRVLPEALGKTWEHLRAHLHD